MSPARGQAFSETWWGSRWIQTLRRFGRGWSRGLTDARGATAGIRDLSISPGKVEAVVSGDDGESFELQVRLRTLHDGTWRRVLRRLAGKALYAARLLSGEMPRDIQRVFAQSRSSLFPRRGREIEFSCSCDEVDAPCGHVAAVQFVLAEAFDRDPFLLFELRGRSREQVLAELREIRGKGASNDRSGTDLLGDEDEYAPPNPEDYSIAGEDLSTLGFHIAAPDVTLGSIRAIGPPRSWPEALEILRAFVPIYRAASAAALEIAWQGEEEIPSAARLSDQESEAELAVMAESMSKPTMSSDDEPRSRRRGGRRRGKRGRGRGGQSPERRRGRRRNAGEADPQRGGQGANKKRRRRRGRRGKGKGGAHATGSAVAGGQQSDQPKKRRRRRRRRGGGSGAGPGESSR